MTGKARGKEEEEEEEQMGVGTRMDKLCVNVGMNRQCNPC